MKNFQDLKSYIEVATRDSFGYHHLPNDISLHIYEGKRQVNFCVKRGDRLLPVCNFVFDQDEVSMYR